MSVDLTGQRLCIDDAEVELTAREWLVLECLVRRTGQIVSKERVQQAVAESRAGHHAERRGSPCLEIARQTRQCRRHPQPARPGLPAGRSEIRVSSVHQPPVGILAGGAAHAAGAVRRAGPLLQQRRAGSHQQRPAAEGSRRTRLMARIEVEARHGDARCRAADGKPPLPAARLDQLRGARRVRHGCCSATRTFPAVSMTDATAADLRHGAARSAAACARSPRASTRSAGVIILTVADLRPPVRARGALRPHEHAAVGFRAARCDAGAGVGRHPARAAARSRRLRDEIARRSALDLRPIDETSVPREIAPVVVTLNRLVPDAAHLGAIAAAVHRQHRASIAHADHRHAGAAGSAGRGPAAAPIKGRLPTLQEGDPPTGAFGQPTADAGARRSRGEHRRQESNQSTRDHRRRSGRQILRPRPAEPISIWAPRLSRPSLVGRSLAARRSA